MAHWIHRYIQKLNNSCALIRQKVAFGIPLYKNRTRLFNKKPTNRHNSLLEVHDTASVKEEFDNLVEEIAAYPEIKESLQRESGHFAEQRTF